MRSAIFFLGLVAAGCPASDPVPSATDGGPRSDTEAGSPSTASGDATVGEGPTSSTETTPGDSDSTETGSLGSSSTGVVGLECLGVDETLTNAFVRVQPADDGWLAPEGTRGLTTFVCAPVAAAGDGVIDVLCGDTAREPTEAVRFEVVTNLQALEAPILSMLGQPQVSMTFQAAARGFGPAGIGWLFSISSMEGDLLILGQSAVGAPLPDAVVPSPELGWDQELILRDPGCAARPSWHDYHVRDRSLALEVPADDGPVMVFDAGLDTVTLNGSVFTIIVPNAFTVVETTCPFCSESDFDLIVLRGLVELP